MRSLASVKKYQANKPRKAAIIKKAVKKGLKDYAQTFKRLATT